MPTAAKILGLSLLPLSIKASLIFHRPHSLQPRGVLERNVQAGGYATTIRVRIAVVSIMRDIHAATFQQLELLSLFCWQGNVCPCSRNRMVDFVAAAKGELDLSIELAAEAKDQ